MSDLIMYAGFGLATYSVIGNDVIQTLGTFLTSNGRKPWYVLWAFAAFILSVTLIYGWYSHNGDPSYGRLIGDDPANPKYPFIQDLSWWYLLPPLVLLFITRWGLPVSTTFLMLTFFQPKGLGPMIGKSFLGYAVAFAFALGFYLFLAKKLEQRFASSRISQKEVKLWTALQWVSTAFLWTQWLIQDFANLYVYLPRQISFLELMGTLVFILALLAYIFYGKGGKIQQIVTSKTNTDDIRSATLIDFSYALMLFVFAHLSKVPMSTTWVFIGLLAGREYALRYLALQLATPSGNGFDLAINFNNSPNFKPNLESVKPVHKMILRDLGKASLGLIVSVILVVLLALFKDGQMPNF